MLIRAVVAATANLEAHVEEVDALNVFPVPDGDTGSNMLATMRSALAEAERLPQAERSLDNVADALSRGALTGARGNSGVILSQIIRGMTEGADGRRRANGLDLAQGLRKGSDVAYGSVLTPVEGTILTVIRDAAEAAESAAGRQPHVEAVLADVIEAAASSVQRTPTLLPVLEDAGVVDSGGQGLYRVLEGMLQVGQEEGAAASSPRLAGSPLVAVDQPIGHDHDHHLGADGHGYETQYLLASARGEIDVARLRAAIQAVGDSVVVAGDARLTRVHVHGPRPDLAIAAGLRLGRLSQVEILDLDDQVSHHLGEQVPTPGVVGWPAVGSPPSPAADIGLIAASGAPGLAEVLASFGARVVRPAQGARPSVGEIAAAIAESGAASAIILPNDRDAVLAARLAASLSAPVEVKVIPTRNAAEGIAALVAFDPDASLEANAAQMEQESSELRSFTVITAAKHSMVDGRAVREGQIIALDAGRHIITAGSDIVDATMEALATLDDFELVTVYSGAGGSAERDARLRSRIEAEHHNVEVEIVDGGQPHDHLLVAVE
jgi:DAK2 domain fusion protein YloV